MGEEPNHTTAREPGPLFFVQSSLSWPLPSFSDTHIFLRFCFNLTLLFAGGAFQRCSGQPDAAQWTTQIQVIRQCKEVPIYVFPEMKLRRLVPSFHIHVHICLQFMYSHGRSTFFAAAYKLNRPQIHECGSREQGQARPSTVSAVLISYRVLFHEKGRCYLRGSAKFSSFSSFFLYKKISEILSLLIQDVAYYLMVTPGIFTRFRV